MKLENYGNIKLIIFDCDGVLIDSETISAEVLSKEFNKLGININTEYVKQNFVGNSYPKVKEHIKTNFNIDLKENFEENYREELLLSFKKDLRAIPGIEDLLRNLNILKCVATSSSLLRAKSSLEMVGLVEYFKDNIYSAYGMGSRGKPSPDIYLNAAKEFNISPENVLVIEDSLLGLKGGKSAGMKVWHFTGASHMKSWNKDHNYEDVPDLVFNNMNDFLKYLPHLSNNIKKENYDAKTN